ncbi:NAD(P)-dependent dehydrogenase (short-subunit alcohol dehydrogenase family) [Rhodopseudomonas julia]|uniref:NAD(P)-dependent dehydrogenase (Short-subunit alcohol dehydrogenase family) n=1 Tax=Rhodopseudomonas julia TaxID=200617 RepID=A0ABU0C313_9BRAD|nr:SDR family oxidoreductase [Rhodopseudomonas julia]MDQ0324865.1 NAD(P)-dependent dehydrogenase (short-subunit alcohol dehydrogenase family) [Rhodopseudomonas julia]
MDLQISDRVALITGARGGIGFETARLLAEEGAKLVLSDLRIDTLEEEAKRLPTDVLCMAADVTDQKAVDALAAAGRERFGKIDIVVHAAGVTGAKGDPLDMSDEDYQEAWDIDFMSAVRVARATLPGMREAKWGRFICVTSENAVQPYWEEATYNAAKAALSAFVKNISYQEAKNGILCNTVAPAFIETPMTDGMMKQRAEKLGVSFEEAIQSFLDEERPGIALKRRGQASEVAAAIALLASERGSFINGSNLRVDGGSVQSVQT